MKSWILPIGVPTYQALARAARATLSSISSISSATNKDEMCNFYLMYWVEGTEPLDLKYCFTSGPPSYHWENSHMNHIPDEEASSL